MGSAISPPTVSLLKPPSANTATPSSLAAKARFQMMTQRAAVKPRSAFFSNPAQALSKPSSVAPAAGPAPGGMLTKPTLGE